jgi:HK97 family phage prohead protease
MLTKTCSARIKAAGASDGIAEGEFKALVSVFGNKDSYGDIVVPGAFKDTLAAWDAKGDPIPVYWSHQMRDPDYCIGEVITAAETADGLEIHGRLDIASTTSKAPQVYELMKSRRVTQFSFSYDVIDGAWVEQKQADGSTDYWYELRAVDLFEAGPTPIGANRATELLAVKTASERASRVVADIKAGRALSATTEATLRDTRTFLKTAITNLDSVLDAVDPSTDGKTGSAAILRPSPVDLAALLDIQLAPAG